MAVLALILRSQQRRKPSSRAGLRACLVGLLCVASLQFTARAEPAPEYQIEAVFLFHFGEFVQWPPQVFAASAAPITLCVLGKDPFGSYLDQVVRNEVVNNRPLVVHRYQRGEALGDCQILFVSDSESEQAKAVLAALKGRNVLTVGEGEDFIASGGMIGFITVNNKIRLLINPHAAKLADLKLSAKLLRSAELTTSAED